MKPKLIERKPPIGGVYFLGDFQWKVLFLQIFFWKPHKKEIPPGGRASFDWNVNKETKWLSCFYLGFWIPKLITGLRPLPFNHSGNRRVFLWKQTFGIPASIWSFVPGMFGSWTWWSSGRYFSTFRFPKDMHIFRDPGRSNWQTRKNTYRGVDLKKTRFVQGGFSCTSSPPSCTWRKVVDGYNRNIFSLPKHHIRMSRAFETLVRPMVRNTGCDPLLLTTPVGATHGFPQHF